MYSIVAHLFDHVMSRSIIIALATLRPGGSKEDFCRASNWGRKKLGEKAKKMEARSNYIRTMSRIFTDSLKKKITCTY